MPKKKFYDNKFDNDRRLVWLRARCQARYRQEPWELSFEEFCQLWSRPELWAQRGRHNPNLVMFRYDPEYPWHIENCCLITRETQLKVTAARKMGYDEQDLFREAIWI